VGRVTIVVRTESGRPLDMPTVRAVGERIDPTAPVTDLATMEQLFANTLSRDLTLALLSSAFAALAALLCDLGVFGMMNFHVATRQRERNAISGSPLGRPPRPGQAAGSRPIPPGVLSDSPGASTHHSRVAYASARSSVSRNTTGTADPKPPDRL
jgi:hypothetical protein